MNSIRGENLGKANALDHYKSNQFMSLLQSVPGALGKI